VTLDYERLKRLVLVARSIPSTERAAWLDTACGGDGALRAEAEALLAHDETPDPRITGRAVRERYAADLAAGLGAPPAPIPERIGPWRLREPIGEGGMGIVYRAEQDEPLKREVALKLVRSGLDAGLLAQRLEAERATLARMEHPFIARVFAAGAEPSVGPYVVMELVRGEPITAFCDQHRLSVRRRVELFIRVCEAVHHAHRKGVLHLDLKPSNVLVTDH
jgi:serine/threonine protein kinase